MSEILRDFRKKSAREKAATLVVTLLVMVLLSTIAVTFIQAVSSERAAARSVANRYHAEILADAAVEQAAATVMSTIRSRPASATYYRANIAGTETINLYLSRYTNFSGNLTVERVPLFSTQFTNFSIFNSPSQLPIQVSPLIVTNRSPQGNLTNTTFNTAADIYTSLNTPTPEHPTGAVGLTVNATAGTPLPLLANWIYVTNSSGAVSGRYAFWMDDESSKIDLRTAGTLPRTDGTNLSEISLNSLIALSPGSISSANINNITLLKNATQLPRSISNIRFSAGDSPLANAAGWNAIRPFITKFSLHDQRSPDGNLTINLNEFITSTTDATQITNQVNTIATAITNNIPTFGTRYYQALGPANSATPTTPLENDQLKYAKKIAANIRDFIDSDNTATVITPPSNGNWRDGQAYTGESPVNTLGGTLPDNTLASNIPIVGKEKGPFLNEYAVAYRVFLSNNQTENTTQNATAPVTLKIRFAHYVELFNPSSQDITYGQLGPNPRIVIASQLQWRNFSGQSIRPSDIVLNIPPVPASEVFIPARGYVVLTTDDTDNYPNNIRINAGTRIIKTPWSLLPENSPTNTKPDGNQDYIEYTVGTNERNDFTYNIRMTSGTYDACRERLLFINDNGIIDYVLRVYSVGGFGSFCLWLGRAIRNPTTILTFVADGWTASNNSNPEGLNSAARLVRGDPRSNTEISAIESNTSAVWKSGDSPQYGNANMTQMTLGAPNYQWNISTGTANIARSSWAEYHSSGNGYIANANMTSSGDLGFIFDPARYSYSEFRSISRTLRVGQPDRPDFNRNLNSSAAVDTNWIGGLGHGNTTHTNYARSASMLADVFRFDNFTSGKLNPNGIARATNSPTLAALLNGFTFESSTGNKSSGTLSGRTLNTNALRTAINNEFAANRPFIGIGDFSRLQVFGTSSTTESIVTGQSMAAFNVSDADREEVFRRTAGLLTTQSLAFSVHAIGQAGTILNNRFIPTSTQQKQVILQFQPNYTSTTYPARPAGWSITKPWQKDL